MTSIQFQGAHIIGQIPLRDGDKAKRDRIAVLKQATEDEINLHAQEGIPAAGFTYCDAFKGVSYKGLATGAEGQQLETLERLKQEYEGSINFDGMSQSERESRLAIAESLGKAIDDLSIFLFKQATGFSRR